LRQEKAKKEQEEDGIVREAIQTFTGGEWRNRK
jgi:hypothetical protein